MAAKKVKTNADAAPGDKSALPETFEEAVARQGVEWGEPQLEGLERQKPSGPVFPTSTLPRSIETIVSGIASAQKMPTAYIGPAIIAGLRGAIGSRVRIAMGPGLVEPVTVYVVLTGPPASGKSTCIRVVANALNEVERRNNDDSPLDAMASRIGQSIAKKRRNQALHAILSNGSTPVTEPDCQSAFKFWTLVYTNRRVSNPALPAGVTSGPSLSRQSMVKRPPEADQLIAKKAAGRPPPPGRLLGPPYYECY